MSAFDRLARSWERNARIDARWAVLALPGKAGRRWDRDEFYATGERDVAELMRYFDERNATPRGGRALDFGCGVGRLTRAYAAYFEQVDGVDVSPTMLDLARRDAGGGGRCRYHLGGPDLRAFPDATFDLVSSILVLQHIPAPFAIGYVREFGRVAAPGGIVLLQAPHARRVPARVRGPLRRAASRLLGGPRIALEMHALQRDAVERALLDSGCAILDVRPDGWAGDEWESYVYLGRKA